jgi:Xaa-Pro aminopeptidase
VELLSALHTRIKAQGADSALIFRTNRFLDTYGVREDENWVQKLAQFTGSSGTLWLGTGACVLFTDSRYYEQAREECKDVAQVLDVSEMVAYIQSHSKKIVVDPWQLSVARFNTLCDQVAPCCVHSAPLFSVENMYEVTQNIFAIPDLGRSPSCWSQHMVTPVLVTRSEELSFLCRLATHNPYLPTLKGYGIGHYDAQKDAIMWYIGLPQQDVSNIQAFPHVHFFSIEDWKSWVHDTIDYSVMRYVPEHTPLALLTWFPGMQPMQWDVPQQRCHKTPQELESIQRAHVWEGAAFTTLLYTLMQQGPLEGITECDVIDQLEMLRKKCAYYQGPSFPTISAMGPSGALIHYSPKSSTARTLTSGAYLIDAGGQYHWGTTDMTRSIWLGDLKVDPLYQEDYTAVLKGHIDVAMQVFPHNTRSSCFDALARAPLWRQYKDYRHSTGHGIGCFSNVHEGPFAISKNSSDLLAAGVVCSNEPGMYRHQCWGIRLENVCCVEEDQAQWLRFRSLSLAPFQRALIQPQDLGSERLAWLDTYHQRVFDTLGPLVEPPVRAWLKAETAPWT